MKGGNIISALASMLLVFWYLTGIVGLDVHVDNHDGDVFVVSLLGHTDCESLHPENKCHCMDHHHGLCHKEDEDCENYIGLISLTGDGFECICDLAPAVTPLMTSAHAPASEDVPLKSSYPVISSDSPPLERLECFCVLRV